MYASYRNAETEEIIEYKKPYGEDFPSYIMRKCESDGKKRKFERWFNSVPVVEVAEGLYGNAKNGYTTGVTYQPASGTPMSSLYGKYGRTAGVESE